MQFTRAFTLNTGSPSHMTLRALLPARLSLSTFPSSFPPLSLSVCSVQCIATDSDSNHINTPSRALLKSRQIGPVFPPLFMCVSGLLCPFSLSCLISVCVSLTCLLVRPKSSYQHLPSPSADPYVLLSHYQLTFAFRLPPRHIHLQQRE